MSEESIIKKVASAIWKQRVETAAKNGVDLSKDDEEFMISANSIVDEARAAIQAYEAAKREELTVVFPAEMTDELRADLEFCRGEQWPQDFPPESANVEPSNHDIVRISGGYIGFKP